MVEYKEEKPDIEKIILLYEDAGWKVYLSDPEKLARAYCNSQYVFSAWKYNDLIGIIRAISDKETILYIQDLIVAKKYQRNGVGSNLMQAMLSKYGLVRQIVLLTDDTESTIKFYKSCGLKEAVDYKTLCFLKYNS